MIRIISGLHKGRRIQAPKTLPVRPTTDRAKEALFSILAPQIYWPDSRALDLFAGTGNISFECASRGCPDITSVDSHIGSIAFIARTAAEFGMPIHAVRSEAQAFLERCGATFDFIFADPPYTEPRESLLALVHAIRSRGLLLPDGVLVLEHDKGTDLGDAEGFRESRRYGGTAFSFF